MSTGDLLTQLLKEHLSRADIFSLLVTVREHREEVEMAEGEQLTLISEALQALMRD